MTRRLLRTPDEIRAAGAAAVAGWRLTDEQADRVAAVLMPVRGQVWLRLDAPADPDRGRAA